MSRKPDPAKARVVLVEDHPMFRERLAQVINKDLQMTVSGEADNLKDALRIIEETRPDVVVADLTLRGPGGLDLLKALRTRNLPTPVLVLSMHAEALYADRAIQAGARGYITKDEDSSQLILAIRKVLAGEVYLSAPMTDRVLRKFSETRTSVDTPRTELLTDRELEIYCLFGGGHTTKEIAAHLSLSENTICTYRQRIKEKLDVKNFTELYSQAARWLGEEEAS
jgi:DNA-binding NarL/FixJ family response regulator